MGIASFPAASSGLTSAIKSIQRGTAASSGNITITAVTVAKTICNSFSTSSAGSVAASGTVAATTGTASAASTSGASMTVKHGQYDAGGYLGPTYRTGGVYSYRDNWNNQEVYFTNNSHNLNAQNINAQNLSLNSASISGGTTSLTTAVYGVYLVDSTTIFATGPCRYEVVEYF
jgi:hypothetical protein